jgi:hypothetical protein
MEEAMTYQAIKNARVRRLERLKQEIEEAYSLESLKRLLPELIDALIEEVKS